MAATISLSCVGKKKNFWTEKKALLYCTSCEKVNLMMIDVSVLFELRLLFGACLCNNDFNLCKSQTKKQFRNVMWCVGEVYVLLIWATRLEYKSGDSRSLHSLSLSLFVAANPSPAALEFVWAYALFLKKNCEGGAPPRQWGRVMRWPKSVRVLEPTTQSSVFQQPMNAPAHC